MGERGWEVGGRGNEGLGVARSRREGRRRGYEREDFTSPSRRGGETTTRITVVIKSRHNLSSSSPRKRPAFGWESGGKALSKICQEPRPQIMAHSDVSQYFRKYESTFNTY